MPERPPEQNEGRPADRDEQMGRKTHGHEDLESIGLRAEDRDIQKRKLFYVKWQSKQTGGKGYNYENEGFTTLEEAKQYAASLDKTKPGFWHYVQETDERGNIIREY
jgi:hypothetical protein